jgi:hypothetical protein
MATLPKSQTPVDATLEETNKLTLITNPALPVNYHDYHVDAKILGGEGLPLAQKVEDVAFLSLQGKDDRNFYKGADSYANKGISFRSGYTQVSGSYSEEDGWWTIATAFVEGLDILGAVTADHIMAQVSTHHPFVDGHVPGVTFVGTRFENLKVNGIPVVPTYALGICGKRPDKGLLYSQKTEFLDGVERQSNVLAGLKDPLATTAAKYHTPAAGFKEKVREFKGPYDNTYEPTTLKCSLVENTDPLTGIQSVGNILTIPEFGSVALAVLEVQQNWEDYPSNWTDGPEIPGGVTTYFDLTMLEIELGSIAGGSIQICNVGANGRTKP